MSGSSNKRSDDRKMEKGYLLIKSTKHAKKVCITCFPPLLQLALMCGHRQDVNLTGLHLIHSLLQNREVLDLLE